MAYEQFLTFLEGTSNTISDFIFKSDVIHHLQPDHIKEAVLAYLKRPSKRLRPAVLLMSCGSVGGEVNSAIGAAAGVELFHTWTLVHDDVIDNDSLRRGELTIHKQMEKVAIREMNLDEKLAMDYGRDIAILAGDVQHGWCNTLFIDCALSSNIDPIVVLTLIRHLQTYVLNMLVYGEVLDVQFGLQKQNIMSISEEEIVNMLWLKTGVLYEFSSLAGAMIGKNTIDMNDPQIKAITQFAGNCGIAFQLQDDILGIVGDEKMLGKPVGSDLREGKKTTILLTALKNANPDQKKQILSTIGNKDATEKEITEVKKLLIELNGIKYTKNLAENYIKKALPYLDSLSESKYTELLREWAGFIIERSF